MRSAIALAVLVLAVASRTRAQEDPDRDPRGEAPPRASSPNEVAQPGEPVREDDTSLEHATPDPTPPVPEPFQREQGAPVIDVIEQAGVGGPTAFGSAGVLEVGGYGSLIAGDGFAAAKLAPFVGWFVYDGLELTFAQEIYAGSTDLGLRFATLTVLEVSGHLRLSDRLLTFLGVAPGVLYNGTDAGFALKSRLGLDVLVGRSGVLHPSLFLLWATAPVLDLSNEPVQGESIAYGIEIAYAVMF